VYNGKVFPTKLRKLLAITGGVALLVILLLSFANVISHYVFGLGEAVILVVFLSLSILIGRRERKNRNLTS
jgi:hypothetical protein